MRLLLVCFTLAAFLFSATFTLAEERILLFHSEITVNRDASLDVVETIRVNAEGSQIRRGIYRDIPLRTMADSGLWDQNGFSLVSVRHNGGGTKYRTEWQGRFIRIYIGDPDVFLPHGQHKYEIAYRTTRQLRFFDDRDELYWNVTGNFWTFPIMEATATVKLPQGATVLGETAYAGGFGSSDTSRHRVTAAEGDRISYAMNAPLLANEGLTIAVGFTKGIVSESSIGNFFTQLWANLGALLFGVGLVTVPIYYTIAWLKVGRDPPGETVIPLFRPPEGLSPAAMSYVHFKAFREARRGASLAFVAALLALGVKKWLIIDEDDGGKVVFRKGGDGSRISELPPGERSLWVGLFGTRQEIRLDKTNGPALQKAHQGLQSSIRHEYQGKFFRYNWGWFIPGPIIAVLSIIVGLILQQWPDESLLAIMPAVFGTAFGTVLLFFGIRSWTGPYTGLFWRLVALLMMALGAIALVGVLFEIYTVPAYPLHKVFGLLVFVAFAMTAAMAYLIGAPTFEGAKMLSRIEGFKLYLTTAESARMNMRDAPEMSEELFERYLPYAAGLGVEEPWSKAFSAHLARVAPDEQRDYEPKWYHGRRWDPSNIAYAATASVAAVSSAMSSAMPAPKSSSGSSGGGFSGGGGGGGGGGGW